MDEVDDGKAGDRGDGLVEYEEFEAWFLQVRKQTFDYSFALVVDVYCCETELRTLGVCRVHVRLLRFGSRRRVKSSQFSTGR